MEFSHNPVMLAETVAALNVRPGGIYADCTAGGGGHSEAICRALGGAGRLVAIDRDPDAVEAVTARLAPFGETATVVRGNFCDLGAILQGLGISALDGVLADLGVSSHQLDTAERGFSYMHDAPLDMRMDPSSQVTARSFTDGSSEEELTAILRDYGEERFARQIARRIFAAREHGGVATTAELAALVRDVVPAKAAKGGHPAKRTFQALRIAVNRELDVIEPLIDSAVSALRPGGRIAVITFHSLEDRIVKRKLAVYARGCTCPPELPVCVCGKKPLLHQLGDTTPSEGELAENPRSHSARLRVAEKL